MQDLKSCGRKALWVRVPPRAQRKLKIKNEKLKIMAKVKKINDIKVVVEEGIRAIKEGRVSECFKNAKEANNFLRTLNSYGKQ